MSETPTPSGRQNWLRQAWQALIRPHASIQEVGERRSVQLGIALILVIWLFILSGFLAGAQRTGYVEALFSFGIALVGLPIAYGFARSRNYRVGAFLFSVLFASSAYVEIIRQGSAADIATEIFIWVPLSLIIASTFLSQPATFLLVGLNIGTILALPLFGVMLPDSIGGLAGVLTVIGFVLMGLNGFRNQTERLRLDEVRTVNRALEDVTANLERRVNERTQELERANLQTAQRAAQLEAVTRLAESISQLQDLNELFRSATRLVSEFFGFYHVGIFLIDADREFAMLQAANSEGGQRMLARAHRLRLGSGVVGYAALTGLPRIALDVGSDAVFFDNPDLPQTRSEAALPLKARGETIGVLDMQSTAPGAFTNEDLRVLITLANQVSIAFENARLLTEARAALRQVEEVYNEFTRAEWSRTVAQIDQPGFRYQHGRIEMIEHPLQSDEVMAATHSGEVVTNPGGDSQEARPAVAVPVKLRGEVIGVLHIEANDPGRGWQADEVDLVEAVAERAALALENARLFQDARRRAAKERLISEATSRISGALNMENILQTTAQELERVLGGSEVLIRFQSREAK